MTMQLIKLYTINDDGNARKEVENAAKGGH